MSTVNIEDAQAHLPQIIGQVPVTGGHFGGGSCSGCQYPTVREVPVFGGQYIGIKILIYGASSMNQKNADGGTQETADGC